MANINDMLMKPLVVGATGGALSLTLVSTSTKLYGLPAPVALGLAMGGANFIAGTIKDTVLDTVMPNNESQFIYDISSPIISGAAALGLVLVATGGKLDKKASLEMFALGFGAEIMGAYVNDNLLGAAIDM